MPMRSGKTKVAVDFCGAMHLKMGVTRVLIVCPLSVVGVWKNELRKHLDPKILDSMEFRVINYELLYDREQWREGGERGWYPVDNQELIDYAAEIIILDESHRIGNPSSVVSKKAFKLGKDAPYKVILTGTPIHRKPFSLFGQFKFLRPEVFGTNYTWFKKKYGLWGGYGNYKLLQYINQEDMRKKIAPFTYYMRHVPERPPTHEVIPVPLQESFEIYNEMASESYVEIAGRSVSAEIIVTKILRLKQILGGWTKDEDGEWIRVGSEKKRIATDFLKEARSNGIRKLVLYAEHIPELKDAAVAARKAGYEIILFHGGVSGPDRERRIAEFEETKKPTVFIAQIRTGSEGIDLSSASTVVYYSLTRDLVAYDQSMARIRKYKDRRPLSYYYLLGKQGDDEPPTMDEINYLAIREGLDVVEFLMNHPELLKGESSV